MLLPRFRDRERIALWTPLHWVLLTAFSAALQLALAGMTGADTLESRVATSSDDAEERPAASANPSSSDLELVHDGGNQTVGMRWTGLAIPPGATITAAYIQFVAKEAQSEVTNLVIRGQAADSPLTFTTGIGGISTRPVTTAQVAWAPVAWAVNEAGTNQRSPDLSTIVQEIVGRPGWASGNAIAILITGTGHRTAWAVDGSAPSAALLHVEYSTVPPPENPPVARLSVSQTSPLNVRADASASTDVDATPIAQYAFDFGDLTPVVTTFAPQAIATHVYASEGTYTVTVIAIDTGNFESLAATASIVVNTSIPGSIERRVAAASDDAEESPGASVNLSSGDLELVTDGSTVQTVGMRWTGVAIPRGATIAAAYVQFGAREAQSEPTTLVFRAHAADNAPAFATTAGNTVMSRVLTTATVSWTPDAWLANELGPKQRTADLRAVFQEIVNRPGWVSGNALALVVTGTGHRTAWSYNGMSTAAPLLHVDYFTGPPPPDVAPAAVLSVAQASSPPLTVTANGTASTDTDLTPIASYEFDFGDGTPLVTTTAPVATATHTYSDVGSYTVKLVAIDTGGLRSSTVEAGITVTPPPDDPPVARITATQIATPPLTVTADASASTDLDASPIARYEFDFGDGSPVVATLAPIATATHTYSSARTYTITVKVTDTASLSSALASVNVEVSAGFAAALDRRVASSTDDAEERPSSTNLSSSDLELVQDSSDNQTVGMRWTGISIPRGATITAAHIQFAARESHTEATNLVIRGQAADNATTFTSTSGGVSSRPRTTSFANWAPESWTAGEVGARQRTTDLAAVVQEIVNRSGWTSGNALVMIVTGTGHRTAFSYDGTVADAPLLHIEYLSNVPPVDDAPVARVSVTQATSPPLTVMADGSASTDVDLTPIRTYRFTFGDGTSAVTTTAPVATTSHTYSAAGTYTVTLIATDTGGKASSPVTSSITVGSASSSQVAVYAGYYDTHHSSRLKTKPSPWKGSSNVTFVGTADPGTSNGWDTSAIRVENLGSSALSGVVVTVNMGSKSFALWGTNSIPAGQSLILAQTGFENFDGSDTSPAGCYSCSPSLCLTAVSSTRPVVHVTVGGRVTDYLDSGQILNTKGADGAGCPSTGTRNDESQAWQRIFPASGTAASNRSETGDDVTTAVRSLSLGRPSPNPTNGDFEITFTLPKPTPVRLAVYDVMGRRVKTYMDDVLESGDYRGHVHLENMAAGLYFFRLWTPDGVHNREFVLVR